MKNRFTKAALLLGIAVAFSTAGFAQETKLKVERDDYQLKVKTDGDEYRVKESGVLPARRTRVSVAEHARVFKEGQAVTTEVKYGSMPEPVAQEEKMIVKKSYTARRKCTCKPVARRSVAKKHAVAYRPKVKKVNRAVAAAPKPAPIVVRDTVMMVRVDTVFTMMEPTYYSGYRTSERIVPAGLKKLKIEHEKGEIQVTEELYDGKKVKKTFDNQDDFDTYMKWKYEE